MQGLAFWTVGIVCILAFPCGSGAEVPGSSLATNVHALFENRCAACHDAARGRSKGGIGYILDLGEVATDEYLVIPGSPGDSVLYQMVESGRMPKDAPPLTELELATIRDWIAFGCPTGVIRAATDVVGSPGATPPVSGGITLDRVGRWLGSFHPLAVHFPIALLLAALFAELIVLLSGQVWLQQAARFCVLLGAPSALAAAALGWLAAGPPGEDGTLLSLHRWLGSATALWGLAVLALSELHRRKPGRRITLGYRGVLALGAILVAITGHFGGTIVFGVDHFRF